MLAGLKDKIFSKTKGSEPEDAPERIEESIDTEEGGSEPSPAGSGKKRFVTAAATLVIVAAAGTFMQNPHATTALGTTVASLVPLPIFPTQAEQTEAQPVLAATAPAEPAAIEPVPAPADVANLPVVTRAASDPLFELPGFAAALGTAKPEIAPSALASAGEATEVVTEPAIPAAEMQADVCAIQMDTEAMPGAMVLLSVAAPCHSGEDVDFAQHGLRFSEQLGPDGSLEIFVPAMAEQAVISARFEDDQTVTSQTIVPDFTDFERVAVMWKGATGLELHALEAGAADGEVGHVWAEQPGLADRAIEGSGGFLTVLGSSINGWFADIYSYPTGLMDSGRDAEISIEARVMEHTCETKIEGAILRGNAGRAPTIEPLSMTVPTCDMVGEYLVLKNLPQDLKLARN